MADATYYNGKANYGGMDVSELKCIMEREAENAKLKCMCAALTLENLARSGRQTHGDVLHLRPLEPFLGTLFLDKCGKKIQRTNMALGIVRHILNLPPNP